MEQRWTKMSDLSLKTSAVTTECFDAMFTSLPTKLKTHSMSGTISTATVKFTPSFNKAVLRQVSDKHHRRPEHILAHGSGGVRGSGGDARGGGRGRRQGYSAQTTGPKFMPVKA